MSLCSILANFFLLARRFHHQKHSGDMGSFLPSTLSMLLTRSTHTGRRYYLCRPGVYIVESSKKNSAQQQSSASFTLAHTEINQNPNVFLSSLFFAGLVGAPVGFGHFGVGRSESHERQPNHGIGRRNSDRLGIANCRSPN